MQLARPPLAEAKEKGESLPDALQSQSQAPCAPSGPCSAWICGEDGGIKNHKAAARGKAQAALVSTQAGTVGSAY